MTAETEVPLPGGVIGAVRVGDTVRKPAGPWTPAVHALLTYLGNVGFEEIPRPLGLDEKGRETLSFVEGDVAAVPWPAFLLQDEGLVAVAELVRRFHDAVVGFRPPSGTKWRIGRRDLEPGEIVCHGDLGLWNIVCREGAPVGIIDWDMAEPGTALFDLALLVLTAIPLRDDAFAAEAGFDSAPPRRARLLRFLDAYGWEGTLEEVIDAVDEMHVRDADRERVLGAQGREPWTTFLHRGDAAIIERDQVWLSRNRSSLL